MARQIRSLNERNSRLFAPEEISLRPTGQGRLRELARKYSARPTRSEVQATEDRKTVERLREWGGELARAFNLRYRSIEPERSGVNGHYGICYEDGEIRIRLRHARTGRLLKESSLVDTLCHELGHLRYFDHSLRFRRFYARILDRARGLGYYRPGPQEGRPRQLSLFDERGCGTGKR